MSNLTPDSTPETIGELFEIMVAASEDEDGGRELEGRFICWLEALPKLLEEYSKLRALASLAETFARENPVQRTPEDIAFSKLYAAMNHTKRVSSSWTWNKEKTAALFRAGHLSAEVKRSRLGPWTSVVYVDGCGDDLVIRYNEDRPTSDEAMAYTENVLRELADDIMKGLP